MLTYSEESRQQLIVRQSCMKAAVDVLIARGIIQVDKELTAPELVSRVKWMTDQFEKVILDA